MGTRADFYIGKGASAEWLGSIALDGDRSCLTQELVFSRNDQEFRDVVTAFLASRDDATVPSQGWPWPWDDSGTSDCSYWYFDGRLWDVHDKYGDGGPVYVPCDEPEPDWGADEQDEDEQSKQWLKDREAVVFPDMKALRNVTFGHRSGIITVGRP